MKAIYIPLISALVGALVGACSSIVTLIVQSRIQGKRDKLKMAADIALEEFKQCYASLKDSGRSGSLMPIGVFLHYHVGLIDLLDSGKLTSENLQKLRSENKKIVETITKEAESSAA